MSQQSNPPAQGASAPSRPALPKHYLLWVIALSSLGVVVSIYSIWHHHQYWLLGATDAACNINAQLSCDRIAGSAYSELAGLPLGVWGLGFFVAIVVLAATLLPKRPLTNHSGSHLAALVLLTYLGVMVSLGLAVLSTVVIGAYCITCVMVYALNVSLGIVSTYYLVTKQVSCSLAWSKAPQSGSAESGDSSTPWSGCLTAAVVVLVVFAGYYNFAKPKPEPSQFADHPQFSQQKTQRAAMENNLEAKVMDIKVHRSPYGELGEDYRVGPDNAPITVVEFIDFECPACARAAPLAKGLAKLYPESVTVVVKNFPLSSACNPHVGSNMHPYACELAIMSRCAGAYGLFWSYHDLAFGQQALLKAGRPQQWAKDVGLTEEQISGCLASEDLASKIQADVAEAHALGVNATPTVFINGRKYIGLRSLDTMAAMVDTLLLLSEDTNPASSDAPSPASTAPLGEPAAP